MDLIVARAVEIYLIAVSGSGLTWFLCNGRKLPVVCSRVNKYSVLVLEHRNRLDIKVGIALYLISVKGLKLTQLCCAE